MKKKYLEIISSLAIEAKNLFSETATDIIASAREIKMKYLKEKEAKKAEEEKQKQIQLAQQKHAQNQEFTFKYSQALSKLLAKAFNALPDYMRISSINIDALALSNQFEDDLWTLRVNIENTEKYSATSLRRLQEELQKVLDNIHRDGVCKFENLIITDAQDYRNLRFAISQGHTSTKSDFDYLRSYTLYYSDYYGMLYQIEVISVTTTEFALVVQYRVISVDDVNKYAPDNYYNLVNAYL